MKRKADEQMTDNNNAVTKYRKKSIPRPITAVDKNLARRIRRLENDDEIKYTDTWFTSTLIPVETTPAWLLSCLNLSVLGTQQNGQRVGTQINTKKLDVRFSIHQNVLNITDNRVRVIFFWFKAPNTLPPLPGEVFDLSLVNAPSYAMLNNQYKDSFKVFYDRTFEMKPLDWNGTTTTIGDQMTMNKSFKLGRKTRYTLGGGAGTYVDIVDNSLYMAAVTSAASGVAGANNPFMTFSSRCWYTDA